MAHIPDGVLSAPVLIVSGGVSAVLLVVALRRLDYDRIPQAALLSAAFFVASLVHIPIGPTSVHPLLNGLMGLVLGWTALPAILIGLLLQAVLFGFGGITVLGVNLINMAVPALLVAVALGPAVRRTNRSKMVFLLGASAGALGVGLTAVLVCASLAFSGDPYVPALGIVVASYVPLAIVEAVVTGACVSMLKKVKPETLGSEGAAHG
jgi:cobalt/nickel transport system permease protein